MKKFTAAAAALAYLAGATLVATAEGVHAPNNPSPVASHGGHMASPSAGHDHMSNKDHMGMSANKMGKAMVKITMPKNNETVKPGMVMVKWTFSKGGEVAMVHLHVDGGKPMPLMGKSTEVMLKPGKHTLMATGATASHKEIGPSDTVTVMVK